MELITRRFLVLPLLCLALAVQGCATLSSAQCERSDWYRIGLTDALAGHPESRVNQHEEACADEGVVPDLAEYRRGREAGLIRYCTTAGGLSAGRQGQEYHWICGSDADATFLVGYDLGKQIYNTRQRIEDVYYDIERYHQLQHQSYAYDGYYRGDRHRRGDGYRDRRGRHYGGRYGYGGGGRFGYNDFGTCSHFGIYQLTRRLADLEIRLRELLIRADRMLGKL